MTVAWESANSDPATATSDTSLVVTKPTGLAVGDLMVAFGGCGNARTISAPSGSWTVVSNDTDGSSRVYVWTKVADSGDTAASNFTFTASGTFNNSICSVHRVSSPSANAPTTGFGTGSNSQTQTAPTITTPSNNCLVFWGCYHSASSTSTASKGTERVDDTNATAACYMAQYTNLEATAGSITGAVITTTAFGAKRVYSVAIETAAATSIAPLYHYQARQRA